MSNYDHVAQQIAELADGMSQAGFTDGVFDEFVRNRIPNVRFDNPKGGLLRKLYLLHLGLADFSLKPAKYRMFDSFEAKEEALGLLEANNFSVHPDDENKIDDWIDLPRLTISAPFMRKEKVIILREALVRAANFKMRFANVAHLEWLCRHPEFVPENWKPILAKQGRIMFPAVSLVKDTKGSEDRSKTIYIPSMNGGHGGHSIEISLSDYQIREGIEEFPAKMIRGVHFFAHFGPVASEDKK